MTEAERTYAIFGSVVFLLAFVFGMRGSIRLTRRYLRAKSAILPENRPVLLVIVVVAWILTVTAGWIGGLSVARLLLQTSFPWTPPITLTFAVVIAYIPTVFDAVIARVARERGDDEE